jgi:hypothetical protein
MNKKAVVILTRGYSNINDYSLLIERNKYIELNIIDKKNTDILIFNENNITYEQQDFIKSKTLSLNIKFISVLDTAFNKDKEKIPVYEKIKNFKIGYRHMCSFWFIHFWNYVTSYDKIIRIDEDCKISFSIDKVFKLLNNNKIIFGKWENDCSYVTYGLNHFTMNFLNTNIEHIPCGPYTNVFAMNLIKLRENKLLFKYIKEIDNSNNIYIFRWGDLPLWGEVLFYMYKKDEYLCTPIIKYYHGSHNLYINDNNKIFDWKKYISYYTDLKHIKTKDDAISHWEKNGINENRLCFIIDEYINFDWETYINNNIGLKYIISSKDEAIEHWKNYGSINGYNYYKKYDFNNFDWQKYINNYEDLKSIKSKEDAINHFKSYGIYENRFFFNINDIVDDIVDDDFYWDLYVIYYKLEKIIYKNNAIHHWNIIGKNYNYIYFKISDYNNFYWEKYTSSYPDLFNLIDTKETAICHWLNFGINENRIYPLIYDNLYKNNLNKIDLNEIKVYKIFINILANSYCKNIIQLILSNIKNYIIIENHIDSNIIISHIMDENKYFDYYNTFKILLSGEPLDSNENYDLFITTFKSNSNKCIYYPYLYYSLYEHRLSINPLDYINIIKKNFCAYLYSREFDHRKYYFNLLYKYKKVDALGKCCNNINIENTRSVYNDNITYNDIAVKIYSEYKFVLAIENTDRIGYATEKLINPLIAGSVPLYWGNNDIFKYINKKRVIYLCDFNNENQLLNYIIFIDNNLNEYNKIINEPIFIIDHENIENNFKNDILQYMSKYI